MKIRFTVDGKVYEADVDVAETESPRPGYVPPALPAPLAAPAAAPATASPVSADESKLCRSPIAGIVVRVPAQVGQVIQVNDVLLVLEAMKMETTITAPISGKVARVNAQPGDSVQAGQVLIEFD